MPESIKIVSIGAGNIAHHLIPALHKIGCVITHVYSRKQTNARSLAVKVNAKAVDDLNTIVDNVDLYLIMVSDDAIIEVVRRLPFEQTDAFIAHTSGSIPSDLLSSVGKNYGVFYPLQTFKKNVDLNLSNVPFLVSGYNTKTIRFLRMLARQISNKVETTDDTDRLYYHMSAVYINNFTNHMACIAKTLLKEKDLNPKYLNPIIKTTAEKLDDNNPCKNQTGPAIREDKKVINKHLNLLKDDPHWKAVYRSISKSIKAHNENTK